ncbi:MAG TPA: hypothetical protein DEE98_08420 [Elusimicrobia bacterium]|nr:MAG: hypothetical protein A2278_09520 [Elusimicrobia bacterium RIFOXYA12_FULL_49_49]OGS08025.1 MAG: hypothetical protein A2204_04510 [Elusimicrobia bacterium RIFOXYA1_FULL_47_7]OGS09791.1 MAG: hypothetical protein A2386_07885 [Elusimicrobia bacterium RIFOXYB1_FULL_48_9]OGS14871.1 MAG: hypothetical protein A2251_04850 [Elusimicrobia bacterium RIFOXYA2_FULL_47_53]OGS26516.1 MAG: hypothetical protein A2339_01855 [Elusimicrobia bacterium RIFOXYB12_FULL_50_12]OGS29918.1 MAG: hypothetical protein
MGLGELGGLLGIISLILLLLTVVSGVKSHKFGINTHKALALSAILAGLSHFVVMAVVKNS